MTITNRVQGAFFDHESDAQLIRLAPNAPPSKGPTKRQGSPWTNEEHDRFLQAMEIFPSGPWKSIAAHVGTRTTRQTMTHAQKYRQKIARWKRGATIKPSATRATAAKTETPPASPAAPHEINVAVDEANEDAMFWEVLQNILDETDGDDSMVSLLSDCQPVKFSESLVAFDAHQPFGFADFAAFV